MLAKTPPEPSAEPTPAAKPAQPRRRTITLTNRAPVQIIEADWPVIAEGSCGYEIEGAPYSWGISIRVRYEAIKEDRRLNLTTGGRYLVHAKYHSWDEEDEEASQIVRVGHLLERNEGSASDLWKHIMTVADELRVRIEGEPMRKKVTHAVDACFANLPVQLLR